MEWQSPAHQMELWNAFLRYAQTHNEVLDSIPNQAYIVLIPAHDLILDHDSLADLLQHGGITPGTPIAYVHLAFSELYFLSDEQSVPPITDAHVEVFPYRAEPVLA